jgi:hypothetical protein
MPYAGSQIAHESKETAGSERGMIIHADSLRIKECKKTGQRIMDDEKYLEGRMKGKD